MELTRWNPWRDMMQLQNRINRVFDESAFQRESGNDNFAMAKWSPAADVYEKDNAFVVRTDLPGIEKKDITVDVKGRTLSIFGERSCESEGKEEKYYRKECAYGKFYRAFTLPVEVNPEKINAEFKDGVLIVTIPKPEEQKPKQIEIH